jgi:hypothetical protein
MVKKTKSSTYKEDEVFDWAPFGSEGMPTSTGPPPYGRGP